MTAPGRAGRGVAGEDPVRPRRISAAAVARLRRLAPDGPDEMGRELAAGPRAVADTLEQLETGRDRVDRLIAGAERVVLVGTGASLAMARTAAPAWRVHRGTGVTGDAVAARAGVPVVVRESTEALFGGRDGDTFGPGDVVIAISQSGGSPETLAAARVASARGARVVAVTAHDPSPLAGAADAVVATPIGEERGAATKSELSALAALLALAGALPCDTAARQATREWLEALVGSWPEVLDGAAVLAAARRTWLVGLGETAGIAHAGLLLWHEKVHRQATASTLSEFRHGPIEAVSARDAILVLEPHEPSAGYRGYLALLARELDELGAASVRVGPSGTTPAGRGAAVVPCGVPATAPPGAGPALALLGTTLRIQQLARATAHAAGTYVDGFRALRRIVTAAPPAFD
jgi:fructoselysine-6-P-deglycase FrlB-like protein